MRVLIQRHIAALPHRKITILDAEILRIGANADLVQIIFVARSKFNPDSNSAIRFRLFTVVPDYREPILDGLTGNDPPSGDRGGPDLVRPEDVVILDVELDAGHGMRERHPEPLVPCRILGVGDDGRAGHGGAGEADGDVRVTGDDLPAVVVAVALALAVAAGSGGDGGPGGGGGGVGGLAVEGLAAGGEDAAEALRDHVHVGQAPGLQNLEFEVAVEEEDGVGFLVLRHREPRRESWCSRRRRSGGG